MNNQNHSPFYIGTPVEVYEYLLVISPPEKIKDGIMLVKEKFHQQHNHIQAVKSKPHITLVNFGATIKEEELIIHRIEKGVSTHHQIEVSLKNFSHFGLHTIYISVETPTPIVKLIQSLYSQLYFLKGRGYFARVPHMTIAKGLDEDKFYPAIAEFHKKEYAATFIADRIVLMKRTGKFNKYEIVKEFKLGIE